MLSFWELMTSEWSSIQDAAGINPGPGKKYSGKSRVAQYCMFILIAQKNMTENWNVNI